MSRVRLVLSWRKKFEFEKEVKQVKKYISRFPRSPPVKMNMQPVLYTPHYKLVTSNRW